MSVMLLILNESLMRPMDNPLLSVQAIYSFSKRKYQRHWEDDRCLHM